MFCQFGKLQKSFDSDVVELPLENPAALFTCDLFLTLGPCPVILSSNLRVQQLNPLTCIRQFLFSQLPTSLRLLERRPHLLILSHREIVATLYNRKLLPQVLLTALGFVEMDLSVLVHRAREFGA